MANDLIPRTTIPDATTVVVEVEVVGKNCLLKDPKFRRLWVSGKSVDLRILSQRYEEVSGSNAVLINMIRNPLGTLATKCEKKREVYTVMANGMLQNKMLKEIQRFIEKKGEILTERGMKIIVKCLQIREPIVTYFESKLPNVGGKEKIIEEIRSCFTNTQGELTKEEAIEKKANELLEMDLEQWWRETYGSGGKKRTGENEWD